MALGAGGAPTSIEYSYSSVLGKHVLRTRGITLTGRGVTQHHAQADSKPYNVYAVTQAAFERISADHPQIGLMSD